METIMANYLASFENLSYNIFDKQLYRRINGQINVGDKIGLIGMNGTGKTTLANIIIGNLYPQSGAVKVETNKIGFIQQENEVQNNSLSALQYCMSQQDTLYPYFQILYDYESKYEHSDIETNEYLSAIDEFSKLAGYEVQSEIQQNLKRSRIPETQPMTDLSGGQKRLLYLIAVVAKNVDLLVLDEPTNHVDIETKAHFFDVMKRFKGGLLVISHDRTLLSKVCNQIWELEDQQLFVYKGNWEMYKEQREILLENRIKLFEKNTKEKERLEDLLERLYSGKASIGKNKGKSIRMVKRRIDRVADKMDPVKPTRDKARINGQLDYSGKYSQFMVRCNEFTATIDGRRIMQPVTFDLQFGEKVALVGPNGAGKSTLMKAILNQATYAELGGNLQLSPSALIGYFDQELELVRSDKPLLDYIKITLDIDTGKAYGMLKKYLFEKSQATELVDRLSGGEKNRLQLMSLIEGNFNLLLLDEPTNHLDLYAIEALEQMLGHYNGTVILISHDEYFMQDVVERTIPLTR